MKNSLFALLLLFPIFLQAQNASLSGQVTDESGKGIPFVSVGVVNLPKPIGVSSNEAGFFSLSVPGNTELKIVFSHTAYQSVEQTLNLPAGKKKNLQVRLKSATVEMEEVSVHGNRRQTSAYVHLSPMAGQSLPGITGGVEGLVMSLPGVNNNNELSSQYSVRGGNFDENLVYVNDIEIYRPFLTRSGEQEGLSFVNPDLVQTLSFSAGGFDARYGDKMSSVLDIRYKQPQSFQGSLGFSFMGGHLHLEGASKNQKFSYLMGLRQKNSQLVLKKLDKSGQYKPSFTDFQALIAYQPNAKNKLELLGNIAHNRYKFTPQSQLTKFGTSGNTKSFWVDFDGFEIDRFTTYFGALNWTCQASAKDQHRLTAVFFNTVERENFDIEGFYRLSESMNDGSGQATEGEVLGSGHYMDHARNYLNGIITSLNYQGRHQAKAAYLQWGLKYQYEDIIDHLDEWHREDSAGYNLPKPPSTPPGEEDPLQPPALQNVYKAYHHTVSHRLNAFAQAKFDFHTNDRYVLDAGIRCAYNTLNQEFTYSPRLNFNMHPDWQREVHFRLSLGHYAQPPFYKEMRNPYGALNLQVKSQKSVHAVFSSELYLKMWERPFKFTAEAYYKYLYDLNPYEVDNVRIRYMANNSGKGYAAGLDFRLDGEFVPGVNSWVSLSFMDTRENITYFDKDGVQRQSGLVARPSNQLVSLNLYVQDYLDFLFKKKNFKIYLNAVYASGLPSGDSKRLENPALMNGRKTKLPDYKRVDAGLSFLLKSEERKFSSRNPFTYLKDIWLTLELFNMFQMRNTISYMWIPTVDGGSYAIPNTLTPLQLNLKLDVTF